MRTDSGCGSTPLVKKARTKSSKTIVKIKIAEGVPDVVRHDSTVIAAYLGQDEEEVVGAAAAGPAPTQAKETG